MDIEWVRPMSEGEIWSRIMPRVYEIEELMLQSCGDTVDWIIVENFKISLCQLLDCIEMIVC